MDQQAAKQKISTLRKTIEDHNYKYYVLANPTITDYQFDMLLKELEQLEQQFPEFDDPNSPTKKVGGSITKTFTHYTHTKPMLSLSNAYSIGEIRAFDERIKRSIDSAYSYVCELKFDGVAISLHYEKGALIRGVTRGDGIEGDVVTENIRTIRSLPLKLRGTDHPEYFEIRGEVVMPLDAFQTFNEKRILNNEPPFANPRNATAGSLKLQESSTVAKRPLDCLLYAVVTEEPGFTSHYESMQNAKKWGFKVHESIKRCSTIENVIAFINDWEIKRATLPFDTDGVVVKIDDFSLQSALGNTSKSPRWAIAYKYPAEKAITRLLSVDYQVGRTGSVTPVANLSPVTLAGTVVKRASLHNEDIMKKLDLRINDSVYVEKGGEIIPKITGVELSLRPANSKPIPFITNCPECNTELLKDPDKANHYCPNEACPPRIKGAIEHFISRKAMDIRSLGEGKVELLFDKGIISNVADLYSISYHDIINLEKAYPSPDGSKIRVVKLKEKSVNNILDGIEQSKQRPFEAVLFALGIRHVGETTAKILAMHFKSIDNIIHASTETLTAVPEIGEVIAQSIISFFADEQYMQIVNRLRNAGLNFEKKMEEEQPETKPLLDMTIVVSGTFVNFSREEIQSTIEKLGGKNVSSISKNTTYLVAGNKTGPAKMEKAKTLGVPIISEDQFIKIINDAT